jgi:hypothetical protein
MGSHHRVTNLARIHLNRLAAPDCRLSAFELVYSQIDPMTKQDPKRPLDTFFLNEFIEITILTTRSLQKASIRACGILVNSFPGNQKKGTLSAAEAVSQSSLCFFECDGTPQQKWQLAGHTDAHP